jgi:hypothetical protein
MVKKIIFSLFLAIIMTGNAASQGFISTTELFSRNGSEPGKLKIVQNPALDTLISRYIIMSTRFQQENDGNYGMNGYRIQIYNSSNRSAREESNKTRAEFISKFPGITSYQKYSEPGWFKIRVGDFRSEAEAMKIFLAISRVFPNAYIVPDVINLPELNRN